MQCSRSSEAVGARSPSATTSAVTDSPHCAERLAGYKVPKAFERVSRLPRTPSGKLLRRDLR